jgi:predicted transposase/invertase (TIGR01784 family)
LFEFLKKIEKILSLRHFDSEDWNYFSLFIVYKLTVSDIPKEEVKSVIAALPKPYNDHIMSTYEAIKQEGIEKGEQIGIQKGEQIGIQKKEVEVVLNSFKNGIEISLIANITNLSENEVTEILKKHGML